jgi:hypothetical protein
VGREEEAIDILELDLLQLDKQHVGIRISHVFTEVCVPFRPYNTSRFDITTDLKKAIYLAVVKGDAFAGGLGLHAEIDSLQWKCSSVRDDSIKHGTGSY